MGELKLLGAQRIKALTNMLNEQEQAELNNVTIRRPKYEESVAYADNEAGLGDLRMIYDTAVEKAKYYADELSLQTGVKHVVKTATTGVSYGNQVGWSGHYNKHQRGNEYEHTAIKKKYADKRNALWLCETLEEAKAIVGIK